MSKEIVDRRTFLKIAVGTGIGVGLGFLAKKIFIEDPIKIPDVEKTDRTPIRSPYYWAAFGEVIRKEDLPLEKARLEGALGLILEDTDRKGFANLSNFQPDYDPNLQLPFTKVSLRSFGIPDIKPDGKEVYVVFSGFANPPAGHPFTAWDIVYDRVISSVPKVKMLSKDVEVYSVGFPQGLGGKVSTEYVKGVQSGTDAYRKLYGEFVKKIIAQNDSSTRIILHGISMGSSIAAMVYETLDESTRKRVQALLDNPIDDNGMLDPKDIRVPIGFFGEGMTRMLLDRRIKSSAEAEEIFYRKYRNLLRQKGIDPEDDPAQAALKQQALKADGNNIMKGIPLNTENYRYYIRRGIWDPTAFPSRNLLKVLRGEIKNKIAATRRGKSSEYAIGETHFINRYRVNKWRRILTTWL